jgi:hypothetical protein
MPLDATRLDTPLLLRLIERLTDMGALGGLLTTDDLAEGVANLYFTEARVRSAILAGIDTTTPGVITAGDTVLLAIGRNAANLTEHESALDPHPQYATDIGLAAGLAAKQDTLVSGTNIKTINGASVLGAGDLVIGGGTGDVVGPGASVNNNVVLQRRHWQAD